MVCGVSAKRGLSFRIMNSKAIICAVSNSEPIGRTESLLTGGVGSVATTLVGVLLLGLIFNVLNFENGLGWISLSAYWQSVVRGVFLMVVVMASSGAARRAARPS